MSCAATFLSNPCPFLNIQHLVLKLFVSGTLLSIWWKPWALFPEVILQFYGVQRPWSPVWILSIKKLWGTAHTQSYKTYLPPLTVIPELLKQHISLDCDLELPGKWFLRVVRPEKSPPATVSICPSPTLIHLLSSPIHSDLHLLTLRKKSTVCWRQYIFRREQNGTTRSIF